MKKKYVKFVIIIISTSVILTGFPLNLFFQKEDTSSILESFASASENDTFIPSIQSDEELLRLANSKIESMTVDEKEFQEEAVKAFSSYSDDEIDIQEMNAEQEQVLTQLIEDNAKTINFPTEADKDSYIDVMLSFYDSTSGNFQNIEEASQALVEEIDKNHSSPADKITGETVLAASHGWISVSLLASVVNTTINLVLIGAGVGSVWVFIKKKGVNYVRNYFKSRVKARIVAFAGAVIGVYATYIWDFMMTVLDPGMRLAKYIDSKDKKRNNGWIEL